MFDIVCDTRLETPTFGRWEAFDLQQDSGVSALVPEVSASSGYSPLCEVQVPVIVARGSKFNLC